MAWWKHPASWISIGSFVISVLSFLFSYALNLPALSNTIDLLEPLQAGKPIRFQMIVTNDGKMTAKKFHAELRYLFGRAEAPFNPEDSATDALRGNGTKNVSDLNPGARTTLISTSNVNLAHRHDVDAVSSGAYRLYIYGRISYNDVLWQSHEYHFCRFYQVVQGADPLKLSMCESYNETL